MSPANNNRIQGLTTIRAFAALHVVFYHMWGHYMPLCQAGWLYDRFVNIGYVGVNLFFILSGYILSYVYLSSAPEPLVDKGKFWKARFARIYPVYAFAFILEIPLVIEHVLQRSDHLRESLIALVTLAANLSLVQAWDMVLKWRWNYPSWTLSVEALFYFLFPLLGVWIWKKSHKGSLLPWMGACYFLLLAPSFLWWATHPRIPENQSPEWLFVQPLFRMPEFTLGVLLMKLQHRWDLEQRAERFAPLLFWGSLAALAGGFAASGLVPVYVLRSGVLDPAFMGLILGIALSKGPVAALLSAGPLVLLGEASYSTYILQAPLQEWVDRIGTAFNVSFCSSGSTNHPLVFTAYLVLLLAGSILSFKYIEVPMRDLIRKTRIELPGWAFRWDPSK